MTQIALGRATKIVAKSHLYRVKTDDERHDTEQRRLDRSRELQLGDAVFGSGAVQAEFSESVLLLQVVVHGQRSVQKSNRQNKAENSCHGQQPDMLRCVAQQQQHT